MLLQRCVTCQEVFWDVQSLADLIRENPFNPRKSQIEKCNLSKPDGTRIGRIERIVADQIRVDPFDPCHPCSVPAALQRVEFGGSLWLALGKVARNTDNIIGYDLGNRIPP